MYKVMLRNLIPLFVVLGVLGCSLTTGTAIASTIIHVPGSYDTHARAIHGNNIVGWYEGVATPAHGFLYDGMVYTTFGVPGATWTHFYGIDGNNIVGYYEDSSAMRHGFLYDGETWTTLDFPGADRTGAYAIEDSNVVGVHFTSGSDHGFLYDGATWTTLDFPGATLTYALGISGSNVVGLYLDANFVEHGFLYDNTSWTTLDFPGASGTGAIGIDGNNIVGYYRGASGLAHGFLYDGATWTPLADIPGSDDTVPTDIHDIGVVGFYSYNKITQEQFNGFHGRIPMASATWTMPESIGPNVNTLENSEFTPRVSEGMLTLFFSSWERPGGYGELDIWVSTRATINDPWGLPTNAGPNVNTEYNDYFAVPSADMLELYFTSDKPGGYNDEDIYVSTRSSQYEDWGEPNNLGPQVNAAAWTCQATLTHDMLLMYLSAEGPNGDSEIFVSTRDSVDDPWEAVANIGAPVNTEYEDTNPSLSPDGLTLYFDSNRPGSPGAGGIWKTTRDSIEDSWREPVALPPCINIYDVFTPWILSDGTTLMFGREVNGNRDICQSIHEPAGMVDFHRFAIFANWWMEPCDEFNDWCDGADLNYSHNVDETDLYTLVDYWLSPWPL